MSNLEGNGPARLIQLMKKHGYNKDSDIETATVVTPAPNLTIRFDRDKLIVDSTVLVVAEHLAEHTRIVTISSVCVDAEMTIQSPLKVGDKVAVISTDNEQTYFVVDKVVV